MATLKKDPLLTVAKVALVVFEILLVFSMVLILFGATAVLTFRRSAILADLAASGAPAGTYAAVLVTLAMFGVLLFLTLCFVIQLKRIVDSVHQGDPFQPANARRLARMGWYALGAQVCEWVVDALVAAYWPYAESLGSENVSVAVESDGSSLTGLFLALTLFILARVFRHGTALREDLEGTV